jgi:intracellular multiplication protein IcmP
MAKKRRESLAFLGDLAEALARPEKESRSGPEAPLSFPSRCVALADAWLRKSEVIDPVAAAMDRHFFTTPALMSALTEARRRAGVLAPAQFAFLKLVDRRLWYALHSLGFESDGPKRHPHPCQRVEAIGARDHWAAERLAWRPIGFASVDRAIGAIKAAAAQGSLKKRPTLALPAKPAAGAPTPRNQENGLSP